MRVLRALAIIGIAAVTSAANAAIVSTWSYTVNTFFNGGDLYNPGTAGAGALGGVHDCTSDVCRWGIPFPSGTAQSRLYILGPGENSTNIGDGSHQATGNIGTTYTGNPDAPPPPLIGPTQSFFHENFVIDIVNSATLRQVDVRTTLDLTPLTVDPTGGGLGPNEGTFQADFVIHFRETPNTDASGNCTATPSPPFNTNGSCPDIFVLTGNLNAASFFHDTGDGNLQQYFLSILELSGGLVPLVDAATCAAVGLPAPCLGFITTEGGLNQADFGFVISTEPLVIQTPEPGILALFALGLVGLGFSVRRRQV